MKLVYNLSLHLRHLSQKKTYIFFLAEKILFCKNPTQQEKGFKQGWGSVFGSMVFKMGSDPDPVYKGKSDQGLNIKI